MVWNYKWIQVENWKIHKHGKIKQHTPEQPMGEINQKGSQKVSWIKWKRKYNTSKLMGRSKNSSKKEIYSDVKAYITGKKKDLK